MFGIQMRFRSVTCTCGQRHRHHNRIVFKLNHDTDTVAVRHCHGTVLSRYGTVTVRHCYGTVLLRYGTVTVRHCYGTALLRYGTVTVRHCNGTDTDTLGTVAKHSTQRYGRKSIFLH